MNPIIDISVAIDAEGGIGLNDELPWKLDKEWRHFLKISTR